MKNVTIETIILVINETGGVGVEEDQIEVSLTELGMNSITFIQIIVKLEEVFDCEIPDSKLLLSEMDTVQKMFNVLQELSETH